MASFTLISFSKEIPRKFKLINWVILIPILFWPLVFYMSIFFFDDPNANPVLVWFLFFGVNLYPMYLIIVFELNARLYKKINFAGYILPLIMIGSLSYFIINQYNSSKKYKDKIELENQKLGDAMEQNTVGQIRTTKPIVADYKKNTYGISLGESYKISEKIIDWRWAALADNDGKIDSTGKDAFIYLGEPLIDYNDGEYLPSLHIETDQNIITSFTCSILFNLEETTNSEEKFLHLINNDIEKLRIDSVNKRIITNGFFESNTEEYIETYTLKKGEKLEYDKFEYTIKIRE